jgi:hypothetical protein
MFLQNERMDSERIREVPFQIILMFMGKPAIKKKNRNMHQLKKHHK